MTAQYSKITNKWIQCLGGKKSKVQLKFNTRNMCQLQCLHETWHRLALHTDVVRAGSLASPPLMSARAKSNEPQLAASYSANHQLQKTWIGRVTQSEVFWSILFLNVNNNVMVKVPLKQKKLVR